MILDICFTIFFFSAVVTLLVLNYKRRNMLYQLIAINSFVAGMNALKELLPSSYAGIINTTRLIIGFGLLGLFVCQNIKRKTYSK